MCKWVQRWSSTLSHSESCCLVRVYGTSLWYSRTPVPDTQ